MLIAHYDPGTFELLGLYESFTAFRRAFSQYSWVDPIQDSHLVDQGVPARLVQETTPPALEYGEAATQVVERQEDGTWLQSWEVESITPQEARTDTLERADDLLDTRVPIVNPVLLHAFMELQVAETEFAAGLTPNAARYPLIQAIATARSITIQQAATQVLKPLRDAWRTRAALYVAKYVDVVGRIAAANSTAEIDAIFEELEGIE